MLGSKSLSVGWLMLTLVVSTPTARAELITFEFTGHINYLEGDLGFLGGSIFIGTPFSGSYTFESTTPDAAPLNPANGEYYGALRGFSVQVGPHVFSEVGTANRISVVHITEGEDTGDAYLVGPGRSFELLGEEVSLTMLLLDYSATAFVNDTLPLFPPDLTLFDDQVFQILDRSPFPDFFVAGEVTSLTLVPEPTSLTLLAVVLFACRCRGRD